MLTNCGILALVLLLAGPLLGPTSLLVVRLETGELEAFIPVRPGERFSLSYVHSIYDQPAEEIFTIDTEGRICLQALRSRSLAVLEYYDREPARKVATGEWEITVRGSSELALPVIADKTGKRTLRVAGREIPLYHLGEGGHFQLQMERWPNWKVLWAEAIGR